MTQSFEVADLKKVMPINQIKWSLMFLCKFQNSVLLIVFFSIFDSLMEVSQMVSLSMVETGVSVYRFLSVIKKKSKHMEGSLIK